MPGTNASRRSPTRRRSTTGDTRYGRLASKKVAKAMHEFKLGELESGRSGKIVKNPKQAIAIGLAEARKKGGKVPPSRTGT
jgi:uncharacterized protein DUF6496